MESLLLIFLRKQEDWFSFPLQKGYLRTEYIFKSGAKWLQGLALHLHMGVWDSRATLTVLAG